MNLNGNTSEMMSDDPGVRVIQYIISVPALVLGLPLNVAALWLILFRIHRWTSSVVYLTSLIVNDCLLIFSLPFKLYAYNNAWDLGRGFCTFLESLVYVNIYGSIMLTVCISSDRFISLQFPFRYNTLCSPHRAALVSLVVWVLVFVSTVPVHKLHNDQNSTDMYCFQGFSGSTWSQFWLISLMETVFFVCTVTMLFFSGRVMQILRKLRRRNPLDDKLRNNKSVKIVLTNLIAFLVCFIPYHVVALVYFLAKYKNLGDKVITPLRKLVHISTSLSSINCLTDGMCYYLILMESLQSKQLERRRLSTRGTIVRTNSYDTPTEQRQMELEKLNAAH